MSLLRGCAGLAVALLLAGAMPAAAQQPPARGCLGCHQEPAAAMPAGSAHGEAAGLRCASCHPITGRHPADGPASAMTFGAHTAFPAQARNAVCLDCHAAAGDEWHGSSHEAAALDCSACHVSHAPREPLRNAAAQAERCYDCHRRQRAEAQKPYAHPLREGRLACSDCHAPHGSASAFELRRPTLNETCYDCHAEKRGPFVFEHAPVAEDCSLCHAAHGSNHPGMLVRRAPLLCQQCHAQAGHASIAGSPGGLPAAGAPSALLVAGNCQNCHAQVHGSNHPAGITLTR